MKSLIKKLILIHKNKSCLIKSKSVDINVKLGRNVKIYQGVLVDKNCSLGDYTYVSFDAKIYANTSIGKFCSIAPNVIIAPGEHEMQNFSTHPIAYDKSWNEYCSTHGIKELSTTIGNDVWIGINAIIKAGITIGNGAVIGAGSVVTKNVPPYAIVAGNPAKIIRYRYNEEELKEIPEQWWDKDINSIKKMAIDTKDE